jgi:hypothetical protein
MSPPPQKQLGYTDLDLEPIMIGNRANEMAGGKAWRRRGKISFRLFRFCIRERTCKLEAEG